MRTAIGGASLPEDVHPLWGNASTPGEIIAWLLRYNQTRLHSTLAYISPMQFEKNWLAAQPK